MLTSITNPNLTVARPGCRRELTFGLMIRRLLWLAFLSLVILAPRITVAQDFDMPWLDPETGKPTPVELKGRQDALTRDRIQVPNYVPRKSAKNNSGGWTPFSMPSNFFDFSWMMDGLIQLLLIVPLVIILALVTWLVMRAKFTGRDKEADAAGRGRRSIADSIKHLPFELDSNMVGDFRFHASQAYQAGNYQRAVICLFSHVLVSLDQNGVLRLKKGKTNRQYLREIRSHQELASYYGQVMVPFEETFFGDHAIEKSTFEKCWNGLDKFQTDLNSAKVVDG